MTQATDFVAALTGKTTRNGRNDPRVSDTILDYIDVWNLAINFGMVDPLLNVGMSEFDDNYVLLGDGIARMTFSDRSTVAITLVRGAWVPVEGLPV